MVLMLNIAEYGLIHTHCILALFQMLLLPDLKSTAVSAVLILREKEIRKNHLQLYHSLLLELKRC